ncbi:DoxX family protein [Agrobacterium tumefaciens]|uniref:Membrane protein n=1 Tax=Agrobacterium tumefaciens TaxID=358 RepID=A0A2L2LKZ5_AGRTU|nr:DoxX family protein [Agrobacterium tumefaciens]AVH44979.1 membrane protein [Agrobacterium tumefaciens]NSY98872.1 DoxX family protein [Agrobacterium tumefaciens]
MIDTRLAPYGILLLRVLTGTALLAHSLYLKVFVLTMPVTVEFFRSLGLPGPIAWLILVLEIVAGVALILGVKPRLAALGATIVLLGATWAHSGNGWEFSSTGGGWEYPFFWSVALISISLLGDGAHFLVPSFQVLGDRKTRLGSRVSDKE